MSKISKGVLCEVIGGVMDLNKGKIVTVESFQGEHSKYGRIWRCTGKDLISEYGIKAIALDFAQDWLRPIPDENLNQKQIKYIEKVA